MKKWALNKISGPSNVVRSGGIDVDKPILLLAGSTVRLSVACDIPLSLPSTSFFHSRYAKDHSRIRSPETRTYTSADQHVILHEPHTGYVLRFTSGVPVHHASGIGNFDRSARAGILYLQHSLSEVDLAYSDLVPSGKISRFKEDRAFQISVQSEAVFIREEPLT